MYNFRYFSPTQKKKKRSFILQIFNSSNRNDIDIMPCYHFNYFMMILSCHIINKMITTCHICKECHVINRGTRKKNKNNLWELKQKNNTMERVK